MYIDRFWIGVVATLGVEVVLFAAAVVLNMKKKRGQ